MDTLRSGEALMKAYGEGEKAAFDLLLRRYQPRVLRFLKRVLGSESLAEDALVETFFKLHLSAGTYEARGRFSTYLFTIAYREAVSIMRKRRHEASSPPLLNGTSWSQNPVAPIAFGSRHPAPDGAIETRETISRVDQALEQLSDIQRAVFLLYYREELSTSEIARTLEIPSGSVRGYLCMARKTIRKFVDSLEARPAAIAAGRR